jgi:hypothetical protein
MLTFRNGFTETTKQKTCLCGQIKIILKADLFKTKEQKPKGVISYWP